MHRLTCGISSLLHSVNLILFTVLLVHLILRISPHHSYHLRSYNLSPLSLLLQSTRPKTYISPFLISIVFLVPFGQPSRILAEMIEIYLKPSLK